MPNKMLAAVKTKPVVGGIDIRKVDVPKIHPDEALVRVRVASICGTDLHIYDWDSWSQSRIKLPLIQGHEFAGEIVEVGSDVLGFGVGDYVSAEGHIPCGRCHQCKTGRAHVCRNLKIVGIDRDGAFAEYVVIPEGNLVRNDESIPPEIATLQDPLGNAVHLIIDANLPGKTVCIFGLGPIGLMCVAVAKAVGASKIFAVSLNQPRRLALAKQLGATQVFTADGDFIERILDETGGEGVDESLEVSGAPLALRNALKVTMPGGGVHILGIYSSPVEVDFSRDVVTRGMRIHGIHGREIFETWYQMAGLLKSGNLDLRPLLTHKFKLEEIDKAMKVMKSGDCGKVVLLIEEVVD